MSDGSNPKPLNSAVADATPVVRTLKICNPKGLHARAAAKFVQTVEKFDATVRVTGGTCGEPCDGASILDLLMLGAGTGSHITIEATGAQAAEVADALALLVAGRFTEEE